MKKVLVSLLTLTLVLSISLSAFAAPVINYAFKDEVDGKVYVFGGTQKTLSASNYADSIAKDFGIELLDKDGKEIATTIGANDATVLANIVAKDNLANETVRKFGFGLVDESNRLGEEFIVRPFYTYTDPTLTAYDSTTYGDYYTVDTTAAGIPAEAEVGYVQAAKNASFKLSDGTILRSSTGNYVTAVPATASVLSFDISSIPADAKKVTVSVGLISSQRSYINAINSSNAEIKFYSVDKNVLDWDNNGTAWTWTTAPAIGTNAESSVTFDYIGKDAEGYQTIIKEENYLGTATIADMERVIYSGSAAALANTTNNGYVFPVDITDAVTTARANGETTFEIAVTTSDVTMTIKNTESNTSTNALIRPVQDQVVPRINYVK